MGFVTLASLIELPVQDHGAIAGSDQAVLMAYYFNKFLKTNKDSVVHDRMYHIRAQKCATNPAKTKQFESYRALILNAQQRFWTKFDIAKSRKQRTQKRPPVNPVRSKRQQLNLSSEEAKEYQNATIQFNTILTNSYQNQNASPEVLMQFKYWRYALNEKLKRIRNILTEQKNLKPLQKKQYQAQESRIRVLIGTQIDHVPPALTVSKPYYIAAMLDFGHRFKLIEKIQQEQGILKDLRGTARTAYARVYGRAKLDDLDRQTRKQEKRVKELVTTLSQNKNDFYVSDSVKQQLKRFAEYTRANK